MTPTERKAFEALRESDAKLMELAESMASEIEKDGTKLNFAWKVIRNARRLTEEPS